MVLECFWYQNDDKVFLFTLRVIFSGFNRSNPTNFSLFFLYGFDDRNVCLSSCAISRIFQGSGSEVAYMLM